MSFAVAELEKANEPLMPFADTFIGTNLAKVADGLSEEEQAEFIRLRGKYMDLAFFVLHFYIDSAALAARMPALPMSMPKPRVGGMPEEIIKQDTLRGFLDATLAALTTAINEFRTLLAKSSSIPNPYSSSSPSPRRRGG